jgi:hypothetical protein
VDVAHSIDVGDLSSVERKRVASIFYDGQHLFAHELNHLFFDRPRQSGTIFDAKAHRVLSSVLLLGMSGYQNFVGDHHTLYMAEDTSMMARVQAVGDRASICKGRFDPLV